MITFSLNKIDDVSPFAAATATTTAVTHSHFSSRVHFDLIQHKFMPPNKIAGCNFQTDKCMRTHAYTHLRNIHLTLQLKWYTFFSLYSLAIFLLSEDAQFFSLVHSCHFGVSKTITWHLLWMGQHTKRRYALTFECVASKWI